MSPKIPTTKSSVQLDLLHPKFVVRLEAFFADPRIRGNVKVSSGCRSYATQMWFYRRYRAGKGNLAANPNRRFGPLGADGKGIWRGSWHMEQDDGFCYAVDLHRATTILSKPEINKIATEYGVVPTIKNRDGSLREWWHHQPRAGVSWFDAPALKGQPSEGMLKYDDAEQVVGSVPPLEPKVDWAGIMAAIAAQRAQVVRKPLIRGSRGPAVKTVQSRLGALGYECGPADGIFGRKTRWAVRRFQKARGLKVDGIVGTGTWDALMKNR